MLDANKGINIPSNNTLEYGVDDDELAKAEVNGKVPDYAYMEVSKDKIVTVGHFCINKYNIDYDNGKTSKSTNNYCAFATVTNVSIDQTAPVVILNGSIKLTATVEASEQTGVIWTSSDSSIATIDSNGLITGVSLGEVTITAKAGLKKATTVLTVKENDSLIAYVGKNIFTNDTINNIVINGITYTTHVYNYDGNQTWDSLTFGNADDVGASGVYAKNMIIVKVKGDLTINSGAIITTYNTIYGGPKGFLLYVTGNLVNNGTISMTARGAFAVGQDVYLWQNGDTSYEYVPAVGGAGGAAITSSDWQAVINGNVGDSGTNRTTGGGGSGANAANDSGSGTNKRISGAGSAGTSYSGGTGGVAAFGNSAQTVNPAPPYGGAGGTYNDSDGQKVKGGGAGNPGGMGKVGPSTNSNATYSGSNGTGGLLIIDANNITNTGTISSNGSQGGSGGTTALLGIPGAGSGAGSINLFYKDTYTSTGTITATGGLAGVKGWPYSFNSGAGGDGSITIGSLQTGTFVKNT